MKILFVLSQIELTGAEVYAGSLASVLKGLGHEIVFVSEKISMEIPFPFYSLALHSQNESYLGRLKNVFSLRRIIQKEKIQLIHSHSRAANLVSHFARGSVPMVVTIHGRWRNHFAARALPCLGNKTVAVCPSLQRYLIDEIHRPSHSISMIPNGIDLKKFHPEDRVKSNPLEILFVGRFSGQKGNAIRFLLENIFPHILGQFKSATVKIVSSSPLPSDMRLIQNLNITLGRTAVVLNQNTIDLPSLYQNASLVIGSGRVALEAMACGKPVVALGESCAPGIVSPENFENAFDTNFGDCGVWNLFLKNNNLVKEISQLLNEPETREFLGSWGRKKILEQFDVRSIARELNKIYLEYAL